MLISSIIKLIIILILINTVYLLKMIRREYSGICKDGIEIIYNNHLILNNNVMNEIIASLDIINEMKQESLQIDFTKEFVIVTTSHASNIRSNIVINNDQIQFMTMTTRDYRSNLSYKIFIIEKLNYTKCNDIPLQ